MSAAADRAEAAADADRPLVVARHPTALKFVVLCGVLMQVLDSTIANVALPHMQAALGATPESVSWVLTSYIVASAMIIPASGWLADSLGVRNLFIGSVVLFVGASMLCGLAVNLPQMVAFRILQGIGGASLMPLGQSTLLNISRPSRQPQALALFGIGVTVGPVIGPVLGGWLTENFDWRWIFLINLPFGLVCLVGLAFLMPRVPSAKRVFDVSGWALIAIALAALQLLLDRGERVDWFNAPECWFEAGIAVSAFWMFFVRSAQTEHPLFPPALLRDRNFACGSLFQFVFGLVQYASLVLLPTMMQALLGYPVLTTGLILASRGLAVIISMSLCGRLIPMVGAFPLLAAGVATTACSLWLMTGWTLAMDSTPIIVSGMIQGLAMGLIYLPLSVMVFSTLPSHLRTDAAGLTNLIRNTGGSIGIALASAVLSRNVQISHADLATHITPYNLAYDPSLLAGLGTPGQELMMAADSLVNRQATMIAFLDDFQLMLLISLAMSPMLLLFRRRSSAAVDGQLPPLSHE